MVTSRKWLDDKNMVFVCQGIDQNFEENKAQIWI